MDYPINNQQFCTQWFRQTGWWDKLFQITGWHEELVNKRFRKTGWSNKWFQQTGWCNHKWFQQTGWCNKWFRKISCDRKRSKKRSKQRSKGSYSHYQQKLYTKIIDQLVCPKVYSSRHPTNKPAHHRQCDGRTRHFEPATDSSSEGERHGRGA